MSNTKEKTWTVYMHTNKVNNKVYVGITSQRPERRWRGGCEYCKKNKDGQYEQPKFANAIKKYGWDGFEHIIWVNNLTYKEACHMEQLLIALWDTIKNGYNITRGGDGNNHTEETKKKISVANTGKKRSEETKDKVRKTQKKRFENLQERLFYSNMAKDRFSIPENNPMFGKHHSEESIQKIKDSKKNKKPVICIETKIVYESTREAGRKLDIDRTVIARCCAYKTGYKTAGGYHWMYYDEWLTLQNDLKGEK